MTSSDPKNAPDTVAREADPRALDFARQFLDLVDAAAPGLVESFHVTGSATLGDWRPGRSDLDFAAVLTRDPTADDLEALRRAHHRFAALPGAPPVDGPWLRPGELAAPATAPGPASRTQRLVERTLAHRDAMAWRMIALGVPVRGGPPEVADAAAAVRAWILGNLRSYWGGWARQGRRLLSRQGLQLLTAWGVVWTVAGVMRQHYTLRTGGVTSKQGAVTWAVETYPGWSQILGEAARLRDGGKGTGPYRSRLARRRDALAFLDWAVALPERLEQG